ncbi:MAG TPA: hypothetical protein VFU85_05610, partial [Nocardioides sp.]|nr:hypothetical protein [Nocardioides sp.]
MTSTSRPSGRRPSRPVVGSRNPTGRPRKVAGRQAPGDKLQEPTAAPPDEQATTPPPPVAEP